MASAAAFAAALNAALVVSFVWPQVLSHALPVWLAPVGAWGLVVCFWVMGWRANWRLLSTMRPEAPAEAGEIEKLFREAQEQYLKGNWIESEALLARIHIKQPGDAEALLLRATIHRRTGRLDAARKLLGRLLENATAARWQHEIASEQQRIEQQAAKAFERREPTSRAA